MFGLFGNLCNMFSALVRVTLFQTWKLKRNQVDIVYVYKTPCSQDSLVSFSAEFGLEYI